MRKAIVLTLFLIGYWIANGQDYLQSANDCFEKGDYECAKRNYELFETFDGRDMSEQIQKADECYKDLIAADAYFADKEYEKARDRYKIVLEKNPTDWYAQIKYNECEKLSQSATTIVTSAPAQTTLPNVQNRRRHSAEPEMIFVEGGSFWMGSWSEKRNSSQTPVHLVSISGFYIGTYEITQGQWKEVMGKNPSKFNKFDNFPVEQVSWDDVQNFIKELNQLTGKNYRLPTEAEWEYAARGGNICQGYTYSGSNNINDVAWYSGNRLIACTHPVGTKHPNELGIYDMNGNVWEWCQDWFGSYPSTTLHDPFGPLSGSARVFRGGSFLSKINRCHVSERGSSFPYYRSHQLGFRLALSQ